MTISIKPTLWAITGAAGQVGRHLRTTLGSQLGNLLLLDMIDPAPVLPNEKSLIVDLRDFNAVHAALEGVTGIIHLGGIADEADFADLVSANIIGTHHVLEAARQHSIRRVVYASSNRATGFYPREGTISSEQPFRPDGLYGVSKAAAETLCRLYSDKFGLEIACLRIGSFEASPSTPRELSTWLSHDDCTRAFNAALTGDYQFTTYYAVSRNTRRWWGLEAGTRIGFHPQDDAENFAPEISGEPTGPQGGTFASHEYTLSRQYNTTPSAGQ